MLNARHCSSSRRSANWLGAVFLAGSLSLPAYLSGGEIDDAKGKLEAKFAADADALAAWCDKHRLPDQAKRTREWVVKRDPRKIYVFVLPGALDPPTGMTDDAGLAEWWRRWTKLRQAMADSLFDLAGKALAEHKSALAFELIRQTVRENPDHDRARAALGFEKHGDGWVSHYAARRLASGETFDERFGWLPSAELSRYEKRERKNRGKWISEQEDAEQHGSIKSGWRIETEHYVVTTDSSLEAGVRLARKLERLNEIWRQVFVAYYMSEAELSKRYQGSPLPPHQIKQHQVVLFRNRDEYNATLKPAQPMIAMTLGYYWFEKHTAYFFAGDEATDANLFHEATHQLFQETRTAVNDLGRKNNFWIVEGIACYMESIVEQPGFAMLGGPDEGRMPAALKRLLDDNFYVPLGEMTALGRDALQHDSRLPRLYSQSSGLTNFLMHYRGGRYRQPLVDYLVAVYTGQAMPDTLAKLTGSRYEQLDEQYRQYMKELAGGL